MPKYLHIRIKRDKCWKSSMKAVSASTTSHQRTKHLTWSSIQPSSVTYNLLNVHEVQDHLGLQHSCIQRYITSKYPGSPHHNQSFLRWPEREGGAAYESPRTQSVRFLSCSNVKKIKIVVGWRRIQLFRKKKGISQSSVLQDKQTERTPAPILWTSRKRLHSWMNS